MSESKTVVMSVNDVKKRFNLLGHIYLLFLFVILVLEQFSDNITLELTKYINIKYETLTLIVLMLGVSLSGLIIFSIFKKRVKIKSNELRRNTKLMEVPFLQLIVLAISFCLLGTFFTSFLNAFMDLEITLMYPIGISFISSDYMNIGLFILLVFIAPIVEEYIFRGITLRFLGRFSNKFGVISTSLLFGLFHLNFVQIIPAFLLSYLLCMITLRYKSIIPSIIVHIVTNLILFSLGIFATTKYSYFIVFIIILYVAAIYIIYKTHNKRVIIPFEPDANTLIKFLFKRYSFILIFIIILVYNIYSIFIL